MKFKKIVLTSFLCSSMFATSVFASSSINLESQFKDTEIQLESLIKDTRFLIQDHELKAGTYVQSEASFYINPEKLALHYTILWEPYDKLIFIGFKEARTGKYGDMMKIGKDGEATGEICLDGKEGYYYILLYYVDTDKDQYVDIIGHFSWIHQ